MNNMQNIVKAYCFANGIKLGHFIKYVGMTKQKGFKWLDGQGKLDADTQRKVMDFLSGNFLRPLDEIITVAG